MKQYNRLHMDKGSNAYRNCAICFGAAIFAFALYFFGFRSLTGMGFGKVLFRLVLPMGICGAFVVLLSVMKWNAPGLYGILGAAMSLVLVIDGFFAGGIISGILCGVLFAVAGAGCLLLCGGFLPYHCPIWVLYAIAEVLRLLLNLKRISLRGWVLELAVMAVVAGVVLLPFAMKIVPSTETEE